MRDVLVARRAKRAVLRCGEACASEPATERLAGDERTRAASARTDAFEQQVGDLGVVLVEAGRLGDRERVVEHLRTTRHGALRVVEGEIGDLTNALLEELDEPFGLDAA